MEIVNRGHSQTRTNSKTQKMKKYGNIIIFNQFTNYPVTSVRFGNNLPLWQNLKTGYFYRISVVFGKNNVLQQILCAFRQKYLDLHGKY